MPSRAPTRLEICVDTAEGLAAAIRGGADRIELCADLGVGGLTPSPGLMASARAAPIPVYAMIRPRAGDFIYGTADIAVMLGDIAAARQAGLAGVVLGASRADRSVDIDTLGTLCRAAAGLGRTLHRAFDLTPDLDVALDAAIELGFERILTSGGATDAAAGRDRLAALVARAGSRITIMAGGGVTPATVGALLQETGVGEVHASAKTAVIQDADLVRWGFCPPTLFATDASIVAALRVAIA
ncbi:copper homeostasis protein CutC [Lichenihabitans sp. Uapishka_5]|uniref:copper homeostasis protein CutC n=1 Tax=Lichenihabitans sp. Uapishka_5 TaxID=3037302 RepID=UPI0029E7E368|nr:copper homeostasis protein CutC [Lichenihabitans sp. Uapishka_5]MDX7949665.1 copper homeostasis protein CutC [Lichenihabitans sp. Uapishka_5]